MCIILIEEELIIRCYVYVFRIKCAEKNEPKYGMIAGDSNAFSQKNIITYVDSFSEWIMWNDFKLTENRRVSFKTQKSIKSRVWFETVYRKATTFV